MATTGKALVQSIDVLTNLGVQICKVICIVDRGEGARDAVAQKDCELESLFDITEIHK